MLCYRCGSHVPDTRETCPTCGLKHDAASRPAAGGLSRRWGEDEPPYKPGDVVALRYAIRELIGAGPLGFVFKAHDPETNAEVALKVVHHRLVQAREERAQFSQVLRAGRRLTHPHLLCVYEEGLDGDSPYFTMPLLGGMTLRKLMEARAARGQPFTLEELEGLLVQVANALDDAHALGPHADLKPENIFILPDMAKVTDFGLGLAIPRLPFIQAQKHFRAGVYVAPEYASGGDFDTRMDVYSLAVIVGELLTGLTPVDGVPPELAPRFPALAAFEPLYRRALNPNPLARPKTVGAFVREYAALLGRPADSLPTEEFVPVAASPVREERSRPRPGASGAAHAALMASARMGEKPPPPVPTDQLPVIASYRPATTQEAPETPIDATQPLDAETLRRMMQPDVPAVDATQPMDAELLAAITANSPELADVVAGRSRPEPARAAPARAVAPAPQRASRKVPWLPVLGVAGLLLGAAVGYVVLRGGPAVEASPVSPAASESAEDLEARLPSPPPVARAVPADGEACPAGMKLIPGGTFLMGTAKDERSKGFDESPLTERQVPAFCMDEFEFPNVPDSEPRVDVSWTEAMQACAQVGKRLCTEAEWEKACKGPEHRRFPYGNTFDPDACNTEDSFGDDRPLARSGQFSRCRSSYGVADLSGNVAEWTASAYTTNTSDMTQKGGAFDRPDYAARCSARKNGAPGDRAPTVGFRCCADVHL